MKDKSTLTDEQQELRKSVKATLVLAYWMYQDALEAGFEKEQAIKLVASILNPK